jgi:hypothetical protein
VPGEFVEDDDEPDRHLLPLQVGVLGLGGVVPEVAGGVLDEPLSALTASQRSRSCS